MGGVLNIPLTNYIATKGGGEGEIFFLTPWGINSSASGWGRWEPKTGLKWVSVERQPPRSYVYPSQQQQL